MRSTRSICTLVLLALASAEESAENCAADGTCGSKTSGLSLIQNPSQRVKALLKTLVHDHEDEHGMTENFDAEAAPGMNLMQNDRNMRGKVVLQELDEEEHKEDEEDHEHDEEHEDHEHEEHDEHSHQDPWEMAHDENHEDEAEHHAEEAQRAREEGRHEDAEHHENHAEHHTQQALMQAGQEGHEEEQAAVEDHD